MMIHEYIAKLEELYGVYGDLEVRCMDDDGFRAYGVEGPETIEVFDGDKIWEKWRLSQIGYKPEVTTVVLLS